MCLRLELYDRLGFAWRLRYCHKDEDFRDELEIHLATLKNKELIEEWHDRKILGGNDWDKDIDNNMENSHIILLLYSSNVSAKPTPFYYFNVKWT